MASGIEVITQRVNTLRNILLGKGLQATLWPPKNVPWVIAIGHLSHADLQIVPSPKRSEYTSGGYAFVTSRIHVGRRGTLKMDFTHETPRFLRGLGFLTDALIEVSGLKAPTVVHQFSDAYR